MNSRRFIRPLGTSHNKEPGFHRAPGGQLSASLRLLLLLRRFRRLIALVLLGLLGRSAPARGHRGCIFVLIIGHSISFEKYQKNIFRCYLQISLFLEIQRYFKIYLLPVCFMLQHEDFAVVVKNRAKPPKPWRWEIYRAGRASPVNRSTESFATVGDATRAGKKALQLFLSECPLPRVKSPKTGM